MRKYVRGKEALLYLISVWDKSKEYFYIQHLHERYTTRRPTGSAPLSVPSHSLINCARNAIPLQYVIIPDGCRPLYFAFDMLCTNASRQVHIKSTYLTIWLRASMHICAPSARRNATDTSNIFNSMLWDLRWFLVKRERN